MTPAEIATHRCSLNSKEARRLATIEQFGMAGRHRLLVADAGGTVQGYAGSMRFRPKPAYETTVETTIYCSPEAAGKGIGSRLYAAPTRQPT
jgi:L-amino acid N-acyltransferase YncA